MELTYNGYPYVSTARGYQVAVLGVPYDGGSTGHGGQRDAPQAIRSAANWPHNEIYDASSKRSVTVKVCDLGDTDVRSSHKKATDQVFDRVYETLALGAVPIVLGGDDSITYPCLHALASQAGEQVRVVHLDAHSDIWEPETDEDYDHGSWMRFALDVGTVSEAWLIGHRCFGPTAKVWKHYASVGHNAIHVTDWVADIHDKLTGHEQSTWLAIDIDVFDPAYAPGTGAPEPMGLNPRQVLPWVQNLCAQIGISGISLTEVLPSRDPAGITSVLANYTVMNCLLGLSDRLTARP
jgi:agmatinase